MKPRALRLICFAWGEAYVDRMLDFSLASAMAPGNLPALAKFFDCTVVILTEKKLFERVKAHPIAQRIGAIGQLRLLVLDDLITEPWQYGMTLAYALFRGLTDLGPTMTETYSMFLNADFVLADGSYERLMPRILAGETAHVAPSYCANEEQVRPILEACARQNDGVIVMPSRDMADLILRYRHNTIRAKTVNQDECHFAHTDQFYWAVDEYTLLGNQMPVALIGMRPERALSDIEAFWDWGVVYDLCPSKNLTPIGDSDDFLMLEMRREAEHRELIRPGRLPAAEIAAGMSGYITQYQLDGVEFPLILHSRDLPATVEDDRAALDICVGEILAALPSTPIWHRNHAQWVYHRYHFERTRRARAARDDVLASIAALEREMAVAPTQALTEGKERLQALQSALRDLDQRHQREKALDHIFAGFLARKTAPAKVDSTLSPRRSTLGKLYHRMFGALPDVRMWSPYYLAQRPFLDGLHRLQAEKPSAVLAICRGENVIRRILAGLDGEHMLLPAITVATIGIEDYTEKFDLCVVELGQEEFLYLPLILGPIMASLRPHGAIRLYWANNLLAPPEVSESIFAEAALRAFTPDVSLTFFGSHLAAAAMRIVNQALVRPGSSLKRRMALGGALAAGVVLALAACVCGCRRASSLKALAAPCIAATATLRKPAATVGRS
jgi:hypothetical protein